MNFGNIPYGHTIYGTLFKANPYDACDPLIPPPWDQNYGTLILLVHRNGCNFSEKVLQAQKVGAGFVLIRDNKEEDGHNIFPIEGTKNIIVQIKIPSILINMHDSANLVRSLESSTKSNNVEMAITFELTKSFKKSTLKFIVSVDEYRGYDLMASFKEYYDRFKSDMVLKIHFKLFERTKSSNNTF